ncbi:amidase [Orrella dioscoreae]|uniref:Amidase n=1 Tax=Orrella dioscoreae TaxID=1851544 RepID=A0A1C3JWH9_9BURK|nr:amidase [Orrella dioscoreae]SBT23649.1 Amidase [Orrella dioscoreae]SOE51489.1 Amidase [Orrella dioscoreae]
MNALTQLTAVQARAAIERGEVRVRELMEAYVQRVQAVNPRVNALVSTCLDQALEEAGRADAQRQAGVRQGPLFGLPVAHKDSYLVRGVRTTFGSEAFRDFVPTQDSAVVARQRAAGAIVLGKSNMPEFGAGSHTFNTLFGPTRNPYRLDVSAGGSSGGAAAALAAGMVALADGSDMGGSLRNPASFCNVVGLRPSLARVPMSPSSYGWNGVTVGGPMGRCVDDVALLFGVLAGSDPGDPLALPADPQDAERLPRRDPKGLRIAVSRDLGGLPVEPAVLAALGEGVAYLRDMGCIVEEAEPDFTEADEAFEILRALAFATNFGTLEPARMAQVKETVRWNIDVGLTQTGADVARAERIRSAMHARMRTLLETYDFLVAPVSQVVPFDVESEYPTRIADVDMPNYIAWMRSCSRLTMTGHPAISVPCAFTPDGLPVGLQIVGRYRRERELLAFARAFEEACPAARVRPGL